MPLPVGQTNDLRAAPPLTLDGDEREHIGGGHLGRRLGDHGEEHFQVIGGRGRSSEGTPR